MNANLYYTLTEKHGLIAVYAIDMSQAKRKLVMYGHSSTEGIHKCVSAIEISDVLSRASVTIPHQACCQS